MTSTVRVDCHSSFKALKEDKILKDLGINLQIGKEKNKNKNGVPEKVVKELLKVNLRNYIVDEVLLSKATFNLNSIIRFTKRNSKELLFKRDQNTGDTLEIKDPEISEKQFQRRNRDNS
jgi:hypothetical protein